MNVYSNPLDLMSKSFHFRDKKAFDPAFSDLGVCKVVAIVVHETGKYELGILDLDGSDYLDYYLMDRLEILPA